MKNGCWPLTTLMMTVALVSLGCKRLSDAWTVSYEYICDVIIHFASLRKNII